LSLYKNNVLIEQKLSTGGPPFNIPNEWPPGVQGIIALCHQNRQHAAFASPTEILGLGHVEIIILDDDPPQQPVEAALGSGNIGGTIDFDDLVVSNSKECRSCIVCQFCDSPFQTLASFLTISITGLVTNVPGCNLAALIMASPLVFELESRSTNNCVYTHTFPVPVACDPIIAPAADSIRITLRPIRGIGLGQGSILIEPSWWIINQVDIIAEAGTFTTDSDNTDPVDCGDENIWSGFKQQLPGTVIDWTGATITAVPS
jgi:hypothetical protein